MAKIFNPTKSPFGVRLPGNAKAFIRPGETVDLELDTDQLAKLERRGCVVSDGLECIPGAVHIVSEKVTQVPDTIQTAMANQVDSLTDGELRAMAKHKGLKLHHKTGRAKLIEALEL